MRHAIFILVIVLFFCSCEKDSEKETAAFRATTNSLEQSNKNINYITKEFRKQLFEKLNDVETGGQAAVWQPKAEKISELALSVIEYIGTLKSQLEGKYNNFEIVKEVFFQQKKGKELFQRLKDFIDSINKNESVGGIYYVESIKKRHDYLDSSKYDQEEFNETFFKHISLAAALSMLTKFENDIRNIENDLVTSCYYRIFGGCDWHYESFQPLIGLSSSCVMAGDEIEINAGIGSFSTSAQPKFAIDGKHIPVNENGMAMYKFKAPSKSGKYYKPINIEYTMSDGTKKSGIRNIEYTVINPQ